MYRARALASALLCYTEMHTRTETRMFTQHKSSTVPNFVPCIRHEVQFEEQFPVHAEWFTVMSKPTGYDVVGSSADYYFFLRGRYALVPGDDG